jgi:hypothetical protein
MSNRIFALLALVATVVICATESAHAWVPAVGAPGPIVGAGLPILAIGYGAYWLVKRYRRKTG